MTNIEAIETLRANYPDACYEQLREAVDAAIVVLKAQDTAGDTVVSRQAAIEAAYQGLQRPSNSDEWKRILEHINAIPSAEVEPVKRGRWIIRPHKMMGECPCCSECGSFNPIEYRYCPNCGARMEKEV